MCGSWVVSGSPVPSFPGVSRRGFGHKDPFHLQVLPTDRGFRIPFAPGRTRSEYFETRGHGSGHGRLSVRLLELVPFLWVLPSLRYSSSEYRGSRGCPRLLYRE